MYFKGVKIFNKKPRNLIIGGSVYGHKNLTKRQLDNDSIKAFLQVGEIVIPKKHARKVEKFLDKEGIKLPNM
jgi:hypothetical protein